MQQTIDNVNYTLVPETAPCEGCAAEYDYKLCQKLNSSEHTCDDGTLWIVNEEPKMKTTNYNGVTYNMVPELGPRSCKGCDAHYTELCSSSNPSCRELQIIYKRVPLEQHTHVERHSRLPARILCKGALGRYPVVALLQLEDGSETPTALQVSQEGILYNQSMELVELVDWSTVEKDTKVHVTGNVPLHFARYENNLVYVYSEGKTSHTALESDVQALGLGQVWL